MNNKFKLSGHVSDVITLFSGTFIVAVSAVINNVVLGRNLEKSDFGRFNAINSTVSLLSLFVLFGLNTTSVRLISKFKKNNPYFVSSAIDRLKYFYRILLLVIFLIYAILIPFISIYIFHDQSLIFLFYISLLYLFSLSYSELTSGFLTGLGEFAQLRYLNYIKALLTLFTMGVTYITCNLFVVYIVFAFSSLVVVFISNKSLSKIIASKFDHIKLNLPEKFNKKIITYSGFVFLGGVVVLPFNYGSNLILSSGEGIHIFAVLSIFSTWQGVLTFFPVTYSKLVLPYISGNKVEQFRIDKFTLTTRVNIFSVYLIYIFLMFTSSFILELYGKSYTVYLTIFNLYLGSTAIAFIGNTYGAQVLIKGYKHTILLGNLMVGLSVFSFTYALHTKIGILALCIGLLIGNCLTFLISFLTIVLKDKFPFRLHLSVISAFSIMLLLILCNYYYKTFFLPLSIFCLFICYLIDRSLKSKT